MKPSSAPRVSRWIPVLLALALAPDLPARPSPTPLANLDPLPLVRAPRRSRPTTLPIDVRRLTSLGAFHTVERDDGLVPSPRFKALVEGRHGFRVGQGLLLYRLVQERYPEPVGRGEVVELHPLGKGRERMVVAFRCAYLRQETLGDRQRGRGILRHHWEPGFDPSRTRYFTYPGNLTGLPRRDYERLAEGKIWVGMTRAQARISMGLPSRSGSRRTGFGWREVWSYPRSFRDRTALVFANDQLRSWKDTWDERLPEGERWSWQDRPTRNPWVGRTNFW